LGGIKTSAAKFPKGIVDDFGKKVIVAKKPERIVSLSPANTEILFAIGAGDKLVGVTEYCNFPPQAKKIEKIGGYSTPNIEAIVAKKPDLIVASYGNGEENIKKLREIGLTVIALNPKSLQGVLQDIILVGKATGYEEEAERLVKNLQERINTVRNKGYKIPESKKPRILWVMWYPELWTAGNETFFDELVNIAGGKNIAHDFKGWKIISKEVVLERDPQIIFCSQHKENREQISQKILNDPQLSQIEAIKNKRVYELNPDIIERPGPRLIEGLEKINYYLQKWLEKEGRG